MFISYKKYLEIRNGQEEAVNRRSDDKMLRRLTEMYIVGRKTHQSSFIIQTHI